MKRETDKKTAFIVDCYDDYEIRLKYVKEALGRAGYHAEIYLSDFDHYAKEKVKDYRDDANYISVQPYKRNLSYQRIHSHQGFANKINQLIENRKPELVYCIVPPNTLAEELGKYKKNHDSFQLVFDVDDLWPETFPNGAAKKIAALPFSVWRNKRDNYLKYADAIITECNLFKDTLKASTLEKKIHTVYMCKKQEITVPIIKEGQLSFVYLGSINSIIDMEAIVSFMKEVNAIKPALLHIIGDGESREELLKKLSNHDIPFTFHGKIFDEQKKRKIYQQCHYGLNLYKRSVCIGLTMKSLDYFSYDLPIINNIHGDTWKLCSQFHIGYNIDSYGIKKAAKEAAALQDYESMQNNVIAIHQRLFEEETCIQSIFSVIKYFSKAQ